VTHIWKRRSASLCLTAPARPRDCGSARRTAPASTRRPPRRTPTSAAAGTTRSANISRRIAGTGCRAGFGAADSLRGVETSGRHSSAHYTPPGRTTTVQAALPAEAADGKSGRHCFVSAPVRGARCPHRAADFLLAGQSCRSAGRRSNTALPTCGRRSAPSLPQNKSGCCWNFSSGA
jgi:hypothetical protein